MIQHVNLCAGVTDFMSSFDRPAIPPRVPPTVAQEDEATARALLHRPTEISTCLHQRRFVLREVEPAIWMALVLTHGSGRTRGPSRPFPTDLVSEAALQASMQHWWDAFRVMHGPALSILHRTKAQPGIVEPAGALPHERLGTLWKRRRKLRTRANRHLRMAMSAGAGADHATSALGEHHGVQTGAEQALACVRLALLAVPAHASERPAATAADEEDEDEDANTSTEAGAAAVSASSATSPSSSVSHQEHEAEAEAEAEVGSPSSSSSSAAGGRGGGANPSKHLSKLGQCIRDLDIATRNALREYRCAPQCRVRMLLRSVLDVALYHSDLGRVSPVSAFDGQVPAAATRDSIRKVERLRERIQRSSGGLVHRVAVYFDGKVALPPSTVPAEAATLGRLLRWHAAQAQTPLAPPEDIAPAWMTSGILHESAALASARRNRVAADVCADAAPAAGASHVREDTSQTLQSQPAFIPADTWVQIDEAGPPPEFSYSALSADDQGYGHDHGHGGAAGLGAHDRSKPYAEPSFTTPFFRATARYHREGLFLSDPGVPDAMEAWALAQQWGETPISKMRPRGAQATLSEAGSGMHDSFGRFQSGGAESSGSGRRQAAIAGAAMRSSAGLAGHSESSPRSRTGSTASSPDVLERQLFLNGRKPAAGSPAGLASGFLALGRMLEAVPAAEKQKICKAMSIGLWCVPHDWPGLASSRDSASAALRDGILSLRSDARAVDGERWGVFAPAVYMHSIPSDPSARGAGGPHGAQTAAEMATQGLHGFAAHCAAQQQPSHRLALLQAGRMTLAFLVPMDTGASGKQLFQLCEQVVGGRVYGDFVAAFESLARAQELARQMEQRETGFMQDAHGGSLELLGLLGSGPCPALGPTISSNPLPITRQVSAFDLAQQGAAFGKLQSSAGLYAQLTPAALAIVNRCADHMRQNSSHVGADLVDAVWAHYHEIAAVFTPVESVPPTAVLEMVANRRPGISRQAKSTSNFMSVETIANYSSVRELRKAQTNMNRNSGRSTAADDKYRSRRGDSGAAELVLTGGARMEASHSVLVAVESGGGKSVLLVEARRRGADGLAERAKNLVQG